MRISFGSSQFFQLTSAEIHWQLTGSSKRRSADSATQSRGTTQRKHRRSTCSPDSKRGDTQRRSSMVTSIRASWRSVHTIHSADAPLYQQHSVIARAESWTVQLELSIGDQGNRSNEACSLARKTRLFSSRKLWKFAWKLEPSSSLRNLSETL